MKKILTLTALLALSGFLLTQPQLKRKGSFGIQPAAMNDSLSQAKGLKETRGIFVARTFPNSTAEAAGMQAGDVLLRVNEKDINDFPALQEAAGQLWEGEKVELEIWRSGKTKILRTDVIGKPYETADNAEVIYGEIKFGKGYLRSIVNRPKTAGPHPAILFIPGYPCASYDGMPPIHPYKKLIDQFVDRGYVVMRVEKPGVGDGTGYDCFEIDIQTENDAFEAGFRTLEKLPYIDPEKLFIFGHSLGGITAPVVASRVEAQGVIVYGTAYEPWWEYLMRMLRFQNPFVGVDWVENEKDMQVYHSLLYEQYVLKKSPKELAQNPDFEKLLTRDFQYDGETGIFGRHYSFWNSVNDLNLTQAWSQVDANVLSVYGEADFEALDAGNHEAIARMVNHYHPGKGTFLLLPGTNHSMIEVGSMEQGIKLQGTPQMREYLINNFSTRLIEECDRWMRKVMEEKG